MKRKPIVKVIAVEVNISGDKNTKLKKTLTQAGEELQTAMRKMKKWNYDFRVQEYPQGFLVIGERTERAEPPPIPFPFSVVLAGPPGRPPEGFVPMRVEHARFIQSLLDVLEKVPPADLPKALPTIVLDGIKGVPGEKLREMISDYEQMAETFEKTHPAECTTGLRVRQVVDVMKKQVQLQTS